MNSIFKNLSLINWRPILEAHDFPAHVEISVFGVGKTLPPNVTLTQQVHGRKVIDTDKNTVLGRIDSIDKGAIAKLPEADGLITSQKNKILGVRTADCLPILLYGAVDSIAISLHAGWKGFTAGILDEGIKCAQTRGFSAKHLGAFIGPAIGIDAFEVGPEVLAAFQDTLDEMELLLCTTKGVHDRWHLDLQLAACFKLMKFGIPPSKISVLRQCTKKNPNYHSFRREGVGCSHNYCTIRLKD